MADDDLSWLTDDEKTALTALLKLMPSLTRVIRVSLMAMCLFIKGAQAQGVGATATAQMLYGMCSTTASDFCNGVFAGWWSVLSVLTVPPALILRSPYSSASRPESRRFILHQVIPQVIEGGRVMRSDGGKVSEPLPFFQATPNELARGYLSAALSACQGFCGFQRPCRGHVTAVV